MKAFITFLISICWSTYSFTQATIPLQATETIVTTLSSDEMNGRASATKYFEKAAEFVESHFSSHQLQPLFTTYRVPYMLKDKEAFNLIACNQAYNPEKRTILLTAHLDHLPNRKTGTDVIMNGANDNASGCTAAIQIGIQLANTPTIDENVIIVLFSGEENGLVGSTMLAKQLKEANYAIDAVFNFEMIGTPMNNPQSVYITGYEFSNMANALNQVLNQEFVVLLEQAKTYKLFYRSDNYPFYKKFNIPSHSISTFDFTNYEYYHHEDDEIENIDVEHMNNIINKVAIGIQRILENDIELNMN